MYAAYAEFNGENENVLCKQVFEISYLKVVTFGVFGTFRAQIKNTSRDHTEMSRHSLERLESILLEIEEIIKFGFVILKWDQKD